MSVRWRRGGQFFGEIVVAVLLCEGVGLLAAWATQSSVLTWYPTLNKPVFTPPNWLFAPTWTLLYALMGIAAWLVWRADAPTRSVREALGLFGLQLFLNGAWSFAFFWARSPAAGLFVILGLWAALAWTLLRFYRVRAAAGWLLVPYILWVTYALALNIAIWVLN